MKTIGLIGGMSWESTIPYYQRINERIKQQLGGLHSAHIVLYSVDFHDIEQLQRSGRWDEAAAHLVHAAQALEKAGADFLVLCTNTMHKVAPAIEAATNIPLLHIADPTAESINQSDLQKIGLLGTRFTMEEDFYRNRLVEKHGLKVLVPVEADRQLVHQVIYEELCLGKLHEASRASFRAIIDRLVAQGAEGIILGCTEIALLVGQTDSSVPLFDTTTLHAVCAADYALQS